MPTLSEGILKAGGITADDTSSVVLNGNRVTVENMNIEGGDNAWFAAEAYRPTAETPATYVQDGVTWTKQATSNDNKNDRDGNTWTLWVNDNDEMIVANQGTAFGTVWGDVGRDVESADQIPVTSTWGLPGEEDGTLIQLYIDNPSTAVMYSLATVGAGFADRVDNQKDSIVAAINRADPSGTSAVKFVGHSLGASASQGLGYVYALDNPDREVSVEAYNAPKLGNLGMQQVYSDLKNSKTYNFSSDTYNIEGDPVSLISLPGIVQADGDDVHWSPQIGITGSLANHDVANWQGATEVPFSGDIGDHVADGAGGGLDIQNTQEKDEFLTAAKTATVDQLDLILADPAIDFINGERDYTDYQDTFDLIIGDTDGKMIRWMTELSPEQAMSRGVQDLLGYATENSFITAADFNDTDEDGFDELAFLNGQDFDALNGHNHNSDFWSQANAESLLSLDGNKSSSALVQAALGEKMTLGNGAQIVDAIDDIGYDSFFNAQTEQDIATMNQEFLATFSVAQAREAELSAEIISIIDKANIRAVQEQAKTALLAINTRSIEQNLEWGGAIWKDETSGTFGHTDPTSGMGAAFDPNPHFSTIHDLGPQFARVGDFHTHGNYNNANGDVTDKANDVDDADDFSREDLIGNEEIAEAVLNDENGPATYTAYLGTPSLDFKSYNPDDKLKADDEFAQPRVFHWPDIYAVS